MPELPEVETVKNSLKPKLIGKQIQNVTIYHKNIIEYPSIDLFQTKIKNQTIQDIKRYGKWLIFVLDDYYLLSHLRMEGKYFFKTPQDKKLKHEHVIFDLNDHTQLRYMDVRKFGKMHLIPKEKIQTIGPFQKIGLEPWDQNLTVSYLKEKLKNKTIPIKTTLLDQSIITGIGNIYADEILFQSHINPLKNSSHLTKLELTNIIKNTKIILEQAIQKGGTTIRSYTSVDGIHGKFQQELYVHCKEGANCKICQTPIQKIKIGGRGTYYCPTCQK